MCMKDFAAAKCIEVQDGEYHEKVFQVGASRQSVSQLAGSWSPMLISLCLSGRLAHKTGPSSLARGLSSTNTELAQVDFTIT